LFTEDIGQKSTDNYEQVPDAATNDELSHSLGRLLPDYRLESHANEWPDLVKADD